MHVLELLVMGFVVVDIVWFGTANVGGIIDAAREARLRRKDGNDFPMRIRVIRHETCLANGTPLNCGSFEVRFPDGRPPSFFYYDDEPGRHMRPDFIDSATAEEQAKALARKEQEKIDSQ